MNSVIFERVTLWLFPILHVFAFYLLMRGHNAAGGGFIAGLVSATAFVLYALATDARHALKRFRFNPIVFAGLGLFVSFLSGFYPTLMKEPFFTGKWGSLFGWVVGTPMSFDIGVYLVVVGVILTILLTLLREE